MKLKKIKKIHLGGFYPPRWSACTPPGGVKPLQVDFSKKKSNIFFLRISARNRIQIAAHDRAKLWSKTGLGHPTLMVSAWLQCVILIEITCLQLDSPHHLFNSIPNVQLQSNIVWLICQIFWPTYNHPVIIGMHRISRFIVLLNSLQLQELKLTPS